MLTKLLIMSILVPITLAPSKQIIAYFDIDHAVELFWVQWLNDDLNACNKITTSLFHKSMTST